MAPKRSSSNTQCNTKQNNTRSRRSASVTSTGTRRSARLAGQDQPTAPPQQEDAPPAESSAAPAETGTLAVIDEASDDEASKPEDAHAEQQLGDNDPLAVIHEGSESEASSLEVQQQLEDKDPLVGINEGADDEAPRTEDVEGRQQLEDNDPPAVIDDVENVEGQQRLEDHDPSPTTIEPAPSHPHDNPLCELSYPEDDPDLPESQQNEASSSLPLQPTIYDYSAPEDIQSGLPSTSQLPDHPPPQLPIAQPRPTLSPSSSTAVALLKRITKLRAAVVDNEFDSDDSSESEDSDSDPAPDASEPEEDTRPFYATHLGDAVDETGTPDWYAPVKGQAWAFYQQRKDIAHCAKLFPHTETLLKNIESSCIREKLFQDRLLVYFREYMAEQEGENQTLQKAPAFSSSKDIYGVTVSELREEVERTRVRPEGENAEQSSSELQASAGIKRPREEEDDVVSEREPRRQRLSPA